MALLNELEEIFGLFRYGLKCVIMVTAGTLFSVGVLARHAVIGPGVLTSAWNIRVIMNAILQRNYTRS
jgi:hypothetical protein